MKILRISLAVTKFKEELNHILQLQLNDSSKAVHFTSEYENKRSVAIESGSGVQEAIYNYVALVKD